MYSKKIIFLVFFILFIFLFLSYDTNFRGPDEPVYFAYTASMVEDGDLNVVNNISHSNDYYFPSGQLFVSKTYNLTDFHSHGGVLFWIPAYTYAKGLHFIAGNLGFKPIHGLMAEKVIKCAMSFSTIIFGFLVALLTFFLCRLFFSERISFWATLVLFFGTPFFYYVVFENGNANIIASLFSILSIWFLVSISHSNIRHWFLYGVFFSICIVVKSDLWMQIFFIIAFFSILKRSQKTGWREGLYFLFGLTPGLVLKFANAFINYGMFYEGYLGVVNLKGFYFTEQLFSPYHGSFYTSPILYFSLAGFIVLSVRLWKGSASVNKDKGEKSLLFVLGLYVLIKILLLSFRYAWGGGSAGGRILLIEFPIFVMLFAYFFQSQKRYTRYFLIVFSAIFILWNFIVISEYMTGVDLKNIGKNVLFSARLDSLRYILKRLFCVRDLGLKLNTLLPILLIFAGAICLVIKTKVLQARNIIVTALSFFSVFLCIDYGIVTIVNLKNNQKNIEQLKSDGFFKQARIIGPDEFNKEENAGSMEEMIRYFTLKGDRKRAEKIKGYKEKIYGQDGPV